MKPRCQLWMLLGNGTWLGMGTGQSSLRLKHHLQAWESRKKSQQASKRSWVFKGLYQTLDWDILIQFLAILYSPGWKNEPYFSSHQACVFSEQGHHAGTPLSSTGAGHLWKAMARIDLSAQHEYFLRELLRLCSNSQIWNLSFQTQPALGFSGVIWRAVFFRAVMEGSLEVDTFYKYSYLAKSPFFH